MEELFVSFFSFKRKGLTILPRLASNSWTQPPDAETPGVLYYV